MNKLRRIALSASVALAFSTPAFADYVGSIANVIPLTTVNFQITHEDLFQVSYLPVHGTTYTSNTCVLRVNRNGVKVQQFIMVDDRVPFDTSRTDIQQYHWDHWASFKPASIGTVGRPKIEIPPSVGIYTVTLLGEENATGNPALGNGHFHGNTLHGCSGSASFTATVTDPNVILSPF